jgi:hypothetical protein
MFGRRRPTVSRSRSRETRRIVGLTMKIKTSPDEYISQKKKKDYGTSKQKMIVRRHGGARRILSSLGFSFFY